MSGGLVLSFLRRPSNSSDWSQQELAEFYRVESALLQGGLSVATDRGISDEGDPWFVFCRADNDEVIAHFARIDSEYLIVSNLYSGVGRGRDFRVLVRQMNESHPLMLTIKRSQGQKVFLHPAAMLSAMLASAYFLTGEREAAVGNSSSDGNSKNTSITSFLTEKLTVVAAAGLVAIWFEQHGESVFKFLENSPLGASDDKAAQLVAAAQDGHDAANMQPMNDVELGAHRIDLSSSNLPQQQDGSGSDLGKFGLTQVAQASSALVSDSDANPASLASNSANTDLVIIPHSDSPQNDTDNALAPINPEPEAVKVVEAASLSSQPNLPSSSAPSSTSLIAETSEAVLLLATSDSSSSLIQPVMLSNNAEPLNLALQQVFAQVGIGTDSIHDQTTIDVANVDSSSSVASSTPATNSPLGLSALTESQIMQTLEAFLQHTPSFEIVVSGSNVMVVDTKVSDAASANFGVLTYDLPDGATLSLVGIIPAHHASVTA